MALAFLLAYFKIILFSIVYKMHFSLIYQTNFTLITRLRESWVDCCIYLGSYVEDGIICGANQFIKVVPPSAQKIDNLSII